MECRWKYYHECHTIASGCSVKSLGCWRLQNPNCAPPELCVQTRFSSAASHRIQYVRRDCPRTFRTVESFSLTKEPQSALWCLKQLGADKEALYDRFRSVWMALIFLGPAQWIRVAVMVRIQCRSIHRLGYSVCVLLHRLAQAANSTKHMNLIRHVCSVSSLDTEQDGMRFISPFWLLRAFRASPCCMD